MGRTHQGYTRADQALPEEEEEEEEEEVRGEGGGEGSEEDLESGRMRRTIFESTGELGKSKSKGRRKVSWDAGASEMNVLHPNIHKEDAMHEQESDDEVPQSFMIETANRQTASKGKLNEASKAASDSRRPLHSVAGRKLPPLSPGQGLPPPVSTPPRPSEVDDSERTPRNIASGESLSTNPKESKPLRGLDDYEKALWNWVNVYNLDAFLQDVYYYYEGKGIYSIALSRGLNLL